MTENKMIRVLIADDFKALRDVIKLFLERPGGFEVIGEAPNLGEALERAREMQPDVILMNDYLPPNNSALASARFREQGFSGAILIISLQPEPDLIQQSFANGVNGFMDKDEIADYLADAVRRVHEGNIYLSPKAEEALNRAET
jgi:DNA-binding NarL/FixJ family response regulator